MKKLGPAEKQRMRLVMKAFRDGIEHIGKVFVREISKEEGRWWPTMAPLRKDERELVWKYMAEHFNRSNSDVKRI